MRHLSIIFTIITSLLLFGCIQADTVIRVNADGSGVIEETVKLSNSLLESLRNFSKGMSESAAATAPDAKEQPKAETPDPIQGMMKDAKIRETQYGPDVKFISATPVKGETASGYKAIYAFKDINKLRVNQNPENKTGLKPAEGNDKAPKKEEIIRFSFVRGPISTLTVTMPETKPEQKPVGEEMLQQPKPVNDPAAAEMMKVIFKDMSIRVAIEINGAIIKTNATYQDKSTVTLVDMNFGKIIEDAKAFEKLNAAQPKTLAEMKELVKGMKGLKIEMNNPVVVQF
jgi:hypothetical protein